MLKHKRIIDTVEAAGTPGKLPKDVSLTGFLLENARRSYNFICGVCPYLTPSFPASVHIYDL